MDGRGEQVTNEDIWKLKVKLHALVWFRAAATALFMAAFVLTVQWHDSGKDPGIVRTGAGILVFMLSSLHVMFLGAIDQERLGSNLDGFKATIYGSMALAATGPFFAVSQEQLHVLVTSGLALVILGVSEFLLARAINNLSGRLNVSKSRKWRRQEQRIEHLLWALGVFAIIGVIVLILEYPQLGAQGTLLAGAIVAGAVVCISVPTLAVANTLLIVILVKCIERITAEDLRAAWRSKGNC